MMTVATYLKTKEESNLINNKNIVIINFNKILMKNFTFTVLIEIHKSLLKNLIYRKPIKKPSQLRKKRDLL